MKYVLISMKHNQELSIHETFYKNLFASNIFCFNLTLDCHYDDQKLRLKSVEVFVFQGIVLCF